MGIISNEEIKVQRWDLKLWVFLILSPNHVPILFHVLTVTL